MEREILSHFQVDEKPINTLEHVPVSPQYLEILTRVLADHGAKLEPANEPVPANIEPGTLMYRVTFPPGTVRSNGVVMMRSHPFVLIFPDRYTMHGATLMSIDQRNDTYINSLSITIGEVNQ